MSNDLKSMSRAELVKLKSDVEKAIRAADARSRREARKAAEKAVAEYGFTLDEVTGEGSKKAKSVSPAKYQNPENPAQTWTGRGRKPAWFTAAIAAGKNIEDLEI